MLQSHLFANTVQLAATDRVLILNSAANPFVPQAAQQVYSGTITLAEDNVSTIVPLIATFPDIAHVAFHDYVLHHEPETMDVALIDLLYQPGNAWILYGLQVAAYALKPGGRLYVVGAKDRGVLSIAKHMQACFDNVETLTISKGHRVLRSLKSSTQKQCMGRENSTSLLQVFANSKLDEGTRLLLTVLDVRADDEALDLGCGAGFIGLHIARQATGGHVTMVDASLAAVATARQAVSDSGLTNIRVLSSDGAQAVLSDRFDLVATNPPFHQGGIQTTAIAERFIRDAARVLRPKGRFFLVANRFLKYEPVLHACFQQVVEVGGDTRYKVLLSSSPLRLPSHS